MQDGVPADSQDLVTLRSTDNGSGTECVERYAET